MGRGRRLRGHLLRLVRHRSLAIGVGALVALPGVLLLASDYQWETGVTDGLALIALATGVAVMWSGFSGRQPDWYDPDSDTEKRV
jgi:hypothetical protein